MTKMKAGGLLFFGSVALFLVGLAGLAYCLWLHEPLALALIGGTNVVAVLGSMVFIYVENRPRLKCVLEKIGTVLAIFIGAALLVTAEVLWWPYHWLSAVFGHVVIVALAGAIGGMCLVYVEAEKEQKAEREKRAAGMEEK